MAEKSEAHAEGNSIPLEQNNKPSTVEIKQHLFI